MKQIRLVEHKRKARNEIKILCNKNFSQKKKIKRKRWKARLKDVKERKFKF